MTKKSGESGVTLFCLAIFALSLTVFAFILATFALNLLKAAHVPWHLLQSTLVHYFLQLSLKGSFRLHFILCKGHKAGWLVIVQNLHLQSSAKNATLFMCHMTAFEILWPRLVFLNVLFLLLNILWQLSNNWSQSEEHEFSSIWQLTLAQCGKVWLNRPRDSADYYDTKMSAQFEELCDSALTRLKRFQVFSPESIIY